MRTTCLSVLLTTVLLTQFSCTPDVTEPPADTSGRGDLVTAEYVTSFTPEQIQPYLSFVGAPLGLELPYSVDAYQVIYQTLAADTELTQVSGVMFIPQGLDTLDLLSVQHGTVFKRSEVGSINPFYAIDGLITAMNGYLVAEPDYLGLGSSQILHPYLLAKLSANTVIDMIRAVRNYGAENSLLIKAPLFLAGYSEGGFVTLATHEIMEQEYADEFQLAGVAPMAGPYDLVGSTRELLGRTTYNNPAYLSYLVAAYNEHYGWQDLDRIFQEPYASRIPGLLDGEHGGDEINGQLTFQLDSLFQPTFRTNFLSGSETDLLAALEDNSPLNWGPIAPVRLIHGTADSTVFYENSVTAYASLRANGGVSVDLVPLQGANHATGAFTAYFLAMEWFDSLRTVAQ